MTELGVGLINDQLLTNVETFMCRIYKLFQTNSADEGRYILFVRAIKPEALCPKKDALLLHTKRAHYQTMVWRKTVCTIPELPDRMKHLTYILEVNLFCVKNINYETR